jgi:uncharacterized protein YndB with AHSA1/START domain
MTDRIEKEVLLRAPLDRVWRAISDSRQFGEWFGARFEGEFVAGEWLNGTIAATAVDAEVARMQEPYAGTPFRILVVRVEPPRHLSFKWHPYPPEEGGDSEEAPMTLVSFDLREREDGVVLEIVEAGFDRIPLERRAAAFTSNEQGWTMQSRLIGKYLARERPE